MSNLVTTRFKACHDRLKEEGKVRSSRQFALQLDYLPQSLSEILKGRRDVTIELLRKAVEVFEMNPVFLLSGEGPMFKSGSESNLRVLSIVTSEDGATERIVHVPKPAQAGYAGQLSDPMFVSELPSYTLPNLRHQPGTYRSFDVAGDSMEPTLFDGEQIVCSFLEPNFWTNSIKDNHVYVIVTQDDVLVKRVQNCIDNENILRLISDNPFYEPYEIQPQEIKEVWLVQSKISSFLPSNNRGRNVHENDLQQLQDTLKSQAEMINGLQNTLASLVGRADFVSQTH